MYSPVWIVVVRFAALVVGVGGVVMIAGVIGGYGGWVLRLKLKRYRLKWEDAIVFELPVFPPTSSCPSASFLRVQDGQRSAAASIDLHRKATARIKTVNRVKTWTVFSS